MIPGVDAFIKQCVEAGVRTGLVTSALPGKVDRMLAGLSVPNPFECLVTADRVERGKPDPECYLLAAKEMGINPEKMVVFEDSVSGVKAALDAGATVIGVNEEHLVGSLRDAGAVEVGKDFRMAEIEFVKKGIRILPGGEKNGQSYIISVN